MSSSQRGLAAVAALSPAFSMPVMAPRPAGPAMRPAPITRSYGYSPDIRSAQPAQRFILGHRQALQRNFSHPIYQTVRPGATSDAIPGARKGFALHVTGYQY